MNVERQKRERAAYEAHKVLCASPDWKPMNNPPMDVWLLVKGDDYMGDWTVEAKLVWKNPQSAKRTAKGWKCRSGNYLDDRPSRWMHIPTAELKAKREGVTTHENP